MCAHLLLYSAIASVCIPCLENSTIDRLPSISNTIRFPAETATSNSSITLAESVSYFRIFRIRLLKSELVHRAPCTPSRIAFINSISNPSQPIEFKPQIKECRSYAADALKSNERFVLFVQTKQPDCSLVSKLVDYIENGARLEILCIDYLGLRPNRNQEALPNTM